MIQRITTFVNANNLEITQLDFASPAALMDYFIGKIGSDDMRGKASKAIGNTLLIWERKK